MKKIDEFDLAIVGGGLVGRCFARALNDAWRVVIVEPQTAPPPDTRTLALSEKARDFLEALGLWQYLAPHACPIRRILISEQGAFGVVRVDSETECLPELGWTVPFARLYEALDDDARKSTARRVTTAHKVCSEEGGVTVTLNGECPDIRARLAVVATGDATALCSRAGFEITRAEYQQSAVILKMRTEQDVGGTAYERFTRHGPMAVMPVADGSCAVVWVHDSIVAQKVSGWSEKQIIKALHDDFGDRLGAILSAQVLATYPLRLSYMRRMVAGNIIAMGNSAHWLHPVAAQGFNLSMRDISSLATCLNKKIVAGKIVMDDMDSFVAELEQWNKERVADARRVIRFTDVLARGFLRHWKPLMPARSLALLALDICPPWRRAIVRRCLGLDAEYLPL